MNELHKIVEVRESNKEESSSSDDPQELETSFEHLEYRENPRVKEVFTDRQNQTSTRETDKTVPGTRETDKTAPALGTRESAALGTRESAALGTRESDFAFADFGTRVSDNPMIEVEQEDSDEFD